MTQFKQRMDDARERVAAQRRANAEAAIQSHVWIRIRRVEEIVDLRRTQIYEAIRRGEFPAPIKVTGSGNASRWDLHEIIAHQEARMAARKRSA